ncbi:MAG: ABC-2 family transporter protein [Clostridia bacterium]|nr:ABC-2 family transporter protein [Clostridia bacterium]
MKQFKKVPAHRLYGTFFSMHLRAAMEYKSSFLMSFFGMTLTSLASFFAIWLLFDRFHTVDGYTLSEVLLCYSVILMGFSVSEIFLRGFDTFAGQVQSGSFDRLLLRPRSLLFSVLVSRMEFARTGRFLQGILVTAYAVTHADIVWTPARAGAYLLMLLGCCVFFSSLLILQAGVCFFTIEGLEVMNIFSHGGKELGSYPLDIYGSRPLILFFTFLVPLACAQYYPFLYLTGRADCGLYALTPLWTLAFLLVCIGVWRIGVRKYQSTGS